MKGVGSLFLTLNNVRVPDTNGSADLANDGIRDLDLQRCKPPRRFFHELCRTD